ncbi:hypothetical protein UZ962_25900, partial [Escherichia coli]|nr:hypothetical protein [Escherichia coli]MDY9213297.1 hypothetical protein [Escherichia coli]MDY9267859.1 hypothetical protein [Escherichia coli]MDY9322610.1 hypothetical protein [Escherichia coli]MDY9327638.1 hypothetical protein [Escherichia coli]
NKTPAISKLELVLDIYPSLSLILRYIYCLVFQGASSNICLLTASIDFANGGGVGFYVAGNDDPG